MKKLLIALLLLPLISLGQQVQVKMVLTGTPTPGSKLVICPLKYNKWGHFDYTQDDRGTGALDAAKVWGGGTASNAVTYTPLTCSDGANVRAQSHPYTGTVASNSWVNPDSAGDWHFAAPFYMDWPAMKTMVDAGWCIVDHGAFHGVDQSGAVALGFTPQKNAFANRNYIFRKLKEQGVEYVTNYGVVPSADSGYHSVWEQMGYVGGTSENAFDNYVANPAQEYINNACAIVTNYINDNRYYVQARQFKDVNASDAVAYYEAFLNALIAQSSASVRNSMSFGVHAFDVANFKIISDYLHDNSGDHILVCGSQENYEYFRCAQLTNVKQWIVGDTLFATLDQRFLPQYIRWRDMSFTLSSNVGISSVTVTGADDYSYNTSTGLLNVYKKKTSGYSLPPYYDATGFVQGKVPLIARNLFIDNNFGDYHDAGLGIDVSKAMLVDGNTTFQYHARLFDGAMLYSPYTLTIDLSDYGVSVDSVRIFRSGNSGFTTYAILIRNDTELPDTIGVWTSGSGWIKFNGPILSKKYVAARLLITSTSTGGFGNEIEVYGNYKPYTEQTYPHRHPPLGQMLGVNTYVWDLIEGTQQNINMAKAVPFTMLGFRSARFYDNANFFPQNGGARYSFNPIALNYYEDNMFRQIKIMNPKLVRWGVVQGQTDQVKQNWRDNPTDIYQIRGKVTSYVDNGSFGTLTLNSYASVGGGGGAGSTAWAVQGTATNGIPTTYPEHFVTVPTSHPTSVQFFINPGLSSFFHAGDTIWARSVGASQINIMYANNTIAGRATLNSWDSVARLTSVVTARKGRNKSATQFLPYLILPNNDSVGLGTNEWVENLNEPNASWAGFPDFVNGQGLAACWSKAYDNNKVFSTFLGSKNQDTSMKFSTSGLAINTVDLNRSASTIAVKMRGNRPKEDVPMQPTYWKAETFGWPDNPFDVIQFHNYSYTGGADQYFQGVNGGLPIELSPSLPAVDEFVWFRNKYAPWAMTDVGEWGIDLHQGSPMACPAIGPYSIDQVRGAWAIRTMLEYNVHGVDYAQWYRLYSYDSTAVQFSTMSVLRDNGDGTFSPRYVVGYDFAQLAQFGDYVYDSTLRNDSIRVHRFRHDTSYMYAIWAVENWTNSSQVFVQKPTFAMRSGTYTLPLQNGTALTVMTFQDGSTQMTSTPGSVEGSGYPVSYDLKPVFIVTGGAPLIQPPPPTETPAGFFKKKKGWKIKAVQTF